MIGFLKNLFVKREDLRRACPLCGEPKSATVAFCDSCGSSPTVRDFAASSIDGISARYTGTNDLGDKELRNLLVDGLAPFLEEAGFRKTRKIGVYERRFKSGIGRISVVWGRDHGMAQAQLSARITFDGLTELVNRFNAATGREEVGEYSVGSDLGVLKGGSMLKFVFIGAADVERELPGIAALIKTVALPFIERYSNVETLYVDSLRRETGGRFNPLVARQWQTALLAAFMLKDADRLDMALTKGEPVLSTHRQGDVATFRSLHQWLRERL